MHNNRYIFAASNLKNATNEWRYIVSMAKCWKKGSNKYTEPTGLKQHQQRYNEKRKQKPNKATKNGCKLKEYAYTASKIRRKI